jgi:hypothetical protein
MRSSTATLLLFAFALTACADQRWHKASADEASLTQDLAACNKLAQEQAARAGNLGLPPAFDPRFGAPVGPSQAEQRLQERQAADACMRQRGYVLAP